MKNPALRFSPALICVVLLVASHPVTARVYRCTGPDGNVSYLQVPCPAGQTGNKMHGIGSKTAIDRDVCALVRDFAVKNSDAIRQGSAPSRLIDKYGGPGYINSLSLNVINFVSGFQHMPEVAAIKIGTLAFNKCTNGGFGQLESNTLPPEIRSPSDTGTSSNPTASPEP